MDVVFLHGWLMGPYLWDIQKQAVDDIATTHVLAAPAHGTPAPPKGFTMAAWADLVMDVLDRRGVERAVFVGHSMSGWLVQQIWRDHPDRVRGIGLVGAAVEPAATPEEKRQFIDVMERTAQDWRAQAPKLANQLIGLKFLADNPEWVDRWADQVQAEYDLPGMVRLITALTERPDYAPSTSRIDVPATVIHGTEDRIFPLDIGRHLASLISGADLVVLDGVGHAPPLEQPTMVARAIRALVKKVTTGDRTEPG